MVRFIIKRRIFENGILHEFYSTIDAEVPELEQYLNRGGFGRESFEYFNIVSGEVVNKEKEA